LHNLELVYVALDEPGPAIAPAVAALKVFEQIDYPNAARVREQPADQMAMLRPAEFYGQTPDHKDHSRTSFR
jgi:hypothetical protein